MLFPNCDWWCMSDNHNTGQTFKKNIENPQDRLNYSNVFKLINNLLF